MQKIGKLPEKALFSGLAPSKSDQRKVALELYLQHVKSVLTDKRDFCEFLSTHILENKSNDQKVCAFCTDFKMKSFRRYVFEFI